MKQRHTRAICLILSIFGCAVQVASQEATFVGGTGQWAPFLSTANQYGSRSFKPNSISFETAAHLTLTGILPLQAGMDVVYSIDKNGGQWKPIEAFVGTTIGFIQVSGGRKKRTFGNQDALSSGNLLFSNNATPMPTVGIESNGWLNVPLTNGLVQVQGGWLHGWLGKSGQVDDVLLHHKFAGIRVGSWQGLKLSYGLQHAAQWGGNVNGVHVYGKVNFDNYIRIVTGKSGTAEATISDQINALGNSIVYQDLRLDYTSENKAWNVALYYQIIQEEGPIKRIFTTPNNEDGLIGLAIHSNKTPIFNHLCVEFLSTTDQSGPYHDLDGIIYGGADGYYRGQYPGGWSYNGLTLGNPFLTSPIYNTGTSKSIENNAVRMVYLAATGIIQPQWTYHIRTAFSKNYGIARLVMPPSKNQFSGMFQTNYRLKHWGLKLGYALDRGSMYGNNQAFTLGMNYYL